MPNLILRNPIPGTGTGDIGLLTHVLVTSIVGRSDGMHGVDLTRLVTETAHQMMSRDNTCTRFAIAGQASGMALKYLLNYTPPLPWSVLGVEMPVGSRFADVVWIHPTGAVVVDELKTGAPKSSAAGRDSWAVQVRDLQVGGVAKWGDSFLGVRLLPLRHPSLAYLRTRFGVTEIDPASHTPFQVR